MKGFLRPSALTPEDALVQLLDARGTALELQVPLKPSFLPVVSPPPFAASPALIFPSLTPPPFSYLLPTPLLFLLFCPSLLPVSHRGGHPKSPIPSLLPQVLADTPMDSDERFQARRMLPGMASALRRVCPPLPPSQPPDSPFSITQTAMREKEQEATAFLRTRGTDPPLRPIDLGRPVGRDVS